MKKKIEMYDSNFDKDYFFIMTLITQVNILIAQALLFTRCLRIIKGWCYSAVAITFVLFFGGGGMFVS